MNTSNMAPQSQSPHRFLPGRRRASPSKQDRTKPTVPGSLRGDGFISESAVVPALTAGRTVVTKPAKLSSRGDGFIQSTPKSKSSSDQFAQTPRFNFAYAATSSRAPQGTPNTKPSLVRIESVQDTSLTDSHDHDDGMLDSGRKALPTTESCTQPCGWAQELPHSPKRRRVDDLSASFEAAFDSPVRPSMFKQPTTPASTLRNGPHQFSRASSIAGSAANESSAARRPAFLKLPAASAENLEPLPEAFSPHRRGEKFVPGGMAATLQQWVVETGQSAVHSRRGQGYLQGEAYLYRVMVDSVSGHGPVLVQGRHQDGARLQLLLISDGKARASHAHAQPGNVIGVRAPSWEVHLAGCSWIVAVDWTMLS